MPELYKPKDERGRFTATAGECQQSGQSGESGGVIGGSVKGFSPCHFSLGQHCKSVLQDVRSLEGGFEAAWGPGRNRKEVFRGSVWIPEPQFRTPGDPLCFRAGCWLPEYLLGGFECCGIMAAAQLLFSNGKQSFCGRGQEPQNGCNQRGNGREQDGRENNSRSAAGVGGTD